MYEIKLTKEELEWVIHKEEVVEGYKKREESYELLTKILSEYVNDFRKMSNFKINEEQREMIESLKNDDFLYGIAVKLFPDG